MGLEAGKRLGPYEIQSALGAGGMGEVYRARDTRLERVVAIKILPAHLSSDPTFRQRFEREARAISSLSHPTICTLFDVGREEGLDYLVLEYVEGETLAKRLERGPVPADQLLRIGIEVSDALEKAHRQGITHRDLKPSNLMLTKTGSKLLDFGLAKLKTDIAPLQTALTEMTADAKQKLTSEGTLVGTFQYMAPEQLEGKEADARTDIFGFGHILYEMATGRTAFAGKTKASLIASILSSEPPPLSQLQPLAPPALERVVQTCLAKDPDERWQTAHDLKLQLQWIAQAGSQAGVAAPVAARRRTRERLAWAVAAILFVSSLAATALYLRLAFLPVWPVRASILPPEKSAFAPGAGPAMISPDGTHLCFVARSPNGQDMLWVRPLAALAAQLLTGTEGAMYPFWSPDSRSIGFFANSKLKKIEASGGPAETLASAPLGRGGAWNPNGMIVFAPGTTSGLFQVSSSGGPTTSVTKLDSSRGETTHRWPQFLPDNRHFLSFVHSATPENSGTFIGSTEDGATKLILKGASNAYYAPPGYLLFVREHTLMAQRFDARSLSLTGEPRPVAESVGVDGNVWRGDFSVSETGALLYHPSGWQGAAGELLLLDRAGKPIRSLGQGAFYNPALSPDSRRAAFSVTDATQGTIDIWIYDFARGFKTRLTFNGTLNLRPTWSADGARVIFLSNPKGTLNIYEKAANGTGTPQPLVENSRQDDDPAVSSDGHYLAYVSQPPAAANFGIWILPLFGDRKSYALIENEFNERFPQFSPNGKWLAYTSDESGRQEVYIVPFPSGNGKWEVSNQGGQQPRWRRDGRELYYLSVDNELVAVDVTERGSTLETGTPRALFQVHLIPGAGSLYAASADGKEFLVPSSLQTGQENSLPATLILNWPAELKK